MTIASDIQTLNPGTIIELFIIDTTPVGGSLVLNFHAGVAYSSTSTWNDVVWSGAYPYTGSPAPRTYTRWPMQASGFQWSGQGPIPRPKITVGDALGVIAQLAIQNNDFVGATLTRKRTLLKYMDAVNFPGGVNPTADPTAHFADDVYVIDRKSAQTDTALEFELTAAFDLTNKMLPGRQIIQNCCSWLYRGAECGYTGGAVADSNDTATSVMANDVCGKRLASCKLRFPSYSVASPLPYGGFPAAGLLKV